MKNNSKVYIGNGDNYHDDKNCCNIDVKDIVTVKQAEKWNYTACKLCIGEVESQ